MDAPQPDTWRTANGSQEPGGQRTRHGRNPSEPRKGIRTAPVSSLQELGGALVAEREAPQTVSGRDGLTDSSILVLSGDLDSLISFGDVRAYLGTEAGQCTIRRHGQEFSLQFPDSAAARRCVMSIVPGDSMRSSRPGAPMLGKPLTKGGKQRRVFVHMQSPAQPPVPTNPPTNPPAPQVPDRMKSAEVENKSMLKASSRLVKPISPIEKGLLGPAPIEKQPSTPSTFKNPPPHLETLPAPLLSPPASQKSSSEGSTKSTAVVSEVGSQEDGQGHELHELLVQETLRLLAEKAALQAEAQEKGRMVDRLERHVAMLQQELDEMHSRLLMSEPVVTSLAERAAVLESALEESIPFEEASKKRKKSGSAASPSVRLETSSLETKVAAGSKPSVERMDVGPTGWGDEGPSPATPLDWSNEIVSNPGGIHTHLNEKSSPSKRANKNRHRRGQAQGAQPLWGVAKGRAQGSKRVEALPHESGWEERTSGSSEATDLRASHGSSVGASGEEALNVAFKGAGSHPPKRGASQDGQWDARSSASSVGDGGLLTPPLQDGEWEWPSTPGKQPSPNLGRRTFPKANTPGKDARIELNQGNEGPKFEVDLGGGLLPIPTGWGDNIGAVEGGAGQFETGENAAIGGRAPKGGRRGGSGRDKDGRARKKSTGEQREGDYAGAPRAREAAGGKWPRGMVT